MEIILGQRPPVNGRKARCLALLMATVKRLWCFAQSPFLDFGIIFALSVMYFAISDGFL